MPMDLEVVAHSSDRPLPIPNPYSEPFWQACRNHELRLQKCTACGTFRYYPRPGCPACQSRDAEWALCSGNGTVYSFTVVHRPLARWFKDQVPVVVAVIELDEHVRMVSNVIDIDPQQVTIGMPVHVVWDDVNDTITLPKFRPTTT